MTCCQTLFAWVSDAGCIRNIGHHLETIIRYQTHLGKSGCSQGEENARHGEARSADFPTASDGGVLGGDGEVSKSYPQPPLPLLPTSGRKR
jgi:hypothetical protein